MTRALELVAHETVEALAGSVEQDGFAYMPAVLDAADVAELRSRIDVLEPDPQAFDRRSASDKHIKVVFNRDAFFLRFLDQAPVVDVAEATLGADCHIIGMTAWMTGSGRPDQRLHADYLPLELAEDLLVGGRARVPVFVATAHYYLNDVYEALGPTMFVPGSHRSGRKPREGERSWRDREERSVLCAAGDVLLFRSDVWHRGSANTSAETRYLLQVHYAQRMIAQKFPPYLRFQFNQRILAQANPRQRRLLGEHEPANYD